MVPAIRPTLELERRLWRQGHQWVAGFDEVGRGAWAGPLSVGVAVVHAGVRTRSIPQWLRDSKSLPEERREQVFETVANWCADAAVGHASPEECDRYGMTLAWRLAAYRALAALEVRPDAVVVDGPWDLLRGPQPKTGAAGGSRTPAMPDSGGEGARPEGDEREGPHQNGVSTDARPGEPRMREGRRSDAPRRETVPGSGVAAALDAEALDGEALLPLALALDAATSDGAVADSPPRPSPPLPAVTLPGVVLPRVRADATCAAVAAASVLAKVVRDRWMRTEAEHFPAYGFDRNKGYPSTRHQIALRGYGLSAIHRRSWAYVADLPWR